MNVRSYEREKVQTTGGGWRIRWLIAMFPVFWGFFFPPSVCFGASEQQPVSSGVDIRIQASPESAFIGDPIHIDLTVAAPAGYRIEIPEPETQTGDFFILDFFQGQGDFNKDKSGEKPQSTENRETSLQRYHARIVAAIYQTGSFTFPAIPIYATDADGDTRELRSPSVDVEIESLLTENDPQLKDLKKQAEIPEPGRWLFFTLLFLAVCALAAVAWYLMRKYRKRPVQTPSIHSVQDPFRRAESDLRNLIARKLPEKGYTKKYYVLLSEIVKKILEEAYGIATVERTTAEIMDSLHTLSGTKESYLEAIESLLLQCDWVKFAKYIPSEGENDSSAENAFRILEQAREYSVGSGQSTMTSGPSIVDNTVTRKGQSDSHREKAR